MYLVVVPSASLQATLNTPTRRRSGVPFAVCARRWALGPVREHEPSHGSPGHGMWRGLLWARGTSHRFR